MCEWRRVYEDHVRASRGDLRKPRGGKIISFQGDSRRVLLAISEGRLCKIRPAIYSPWPFHTWGIDILGPFPLAIRQMKYLIVAIEYFTKWIEAEPVAQITAHKVQHFVWKNIVCRFGVPRRLISDNGTQFASQQLGKLCAEVGIKLVLA